jgi:hypothetical protein
MTQPKWSSPGNTIAAALRVAAIVALTNVVVICQPGPANAQSTDRPTISIAATISAETATQVPFPIRVAPTGAVPRGSFVRVRGVPPTAALSEGHSIAPGSWAIPLQALGDLKITLPATAEGRADVLVSLVAVDGSVVAEVKSTLIVAPPRSPAGAPLPAPADHSGPAARVAVPAILPEERERALKLMKKGDEQLAQGLVAPARLLYERAADLGFAPAAMALAGTYDPAALTSLHLRGVSPDAAQARRWYERARQLGSAEADQQLRRLSEK